MIAEGVVRRVGLAALTTALTAAVSLVPGAALAQGAEAQGWWNALHPAGAPAPPNPPDVGPDDLLLQGGDPARLLPLGQPAEASAIGALRFHVAPGSEVGALVLQVGTGAQAADVRAYPAAAGWAPAQGGPMQDAPATDATRFSSGRLSEDGGTLVFPDAGRLVTEQGLLSLVLVAGPADRVVVHHPGPTALAVTPPPAEAPQTFAPAPAPAAPPGPVAAPVLPEVVAPLLPVAPAQPAPSVVVAPVPSPIAAAAPRTQPAAAARRLVPDDDRTRLLVLGEALLVVAFFGLLGQGPLSALARLTGDSAGTVDRGVGRFRAERAGRPPRV